MSHSVKRANSKFEQFRMAVPADLRELVGQREWTRSLGTTDPLEAAIERARLTAYHKGLIAKLRAKIGGDLVNWAKDLVDQALAKHAQQFGSLDRAIAHHLSVLGGGVMESWSPPADIDRRQLCGDVYVYEPAPEYLPIPPIDDEDERETIKLRADFLEGRGIADGYVHRDIAIAVLQHREFKSIDFAIWPLEQIEPGLKIAQRTAYDAIAEHYLTRLTEHKFASWPKKIDQAFGNSASPAGAELGCSNPSG